MMSFETIEFSTGYYYLYDAGYPNAKGFLAPYRREMIPPFRVAWQR